MKPKINRKLSTPGQIQRRWSSFAWDECPEVMIALPFPGGVLFGARTAGNEKRVSFFLAAEDAEFFGMHLIQSAKTASKAFDKNFPPTKIQSEE